jgi:hypothetical protein
LARSHHTVVVQVVEIVAQLGPLDQACSQQRVDRADRSAEARGGQQVEGHAFGPRDPDSLPWQTLTRADADASHEQSTPSPWTAVDGDNQLNGVERHGQGEAAHGGG